MRAHAGSSSSRSAAAAADEQLFKQDMDAAFADEESEEEKENAAASAAGSSIASTLPPDVSLLSALASDASLQSLSPLPLAAIRTAVTCLQHAIHSETVAHALTLYRYLRLLQKLMAMRRYTRLSAARKLNGWLAAAYSQQLSELVRRIKRDGHRLFDLFSEPADDDEWWPQLLQAIGAAGGRAKQLIEALLMLEFHHAAIVEMYDPAERLQLMRYYLLGKRWSARQIEAGLLQDGVIQIEADAAAAAAAAAAHPPPLLQAPLPQQQSEEKDGAESHEGT